MFERNTFSALPRKSCRLNRVVTLVRLQYVQTTDSSGAAAATTNRYRKTDQPVLPKRSNWFPLFDLYLTSICPLFDLYLTSI